MKPRISSTTAIYRSRNVRATLDETERDKVQTARDRIGEALAETPSDVVRAKLEAARDALDEVLGAVAARETGAFGHWPILARRPLQLERGRTPAPRPRSIHDVIRDHYRSRD